MNNDNTQPKAYPVVQDDLRTAIRVLGTILKTRTPTGNYSSTHPLYNELLKHQHALLRAINSCYRKFAIEGWESIKPEHYQDYRAMCYQLEAITKRSKTLLSVAWALKTELNTDPGMPSEGAR